MKTKPFDWKFAALCVFVFVGCIGGWVIVLAGAVELWRHTTEDLTLEHTAEANGGWSAEGQDTNGVEHLSRTAQNGDIERLALLGNGVGLYTRCTPPDPFPLATGCTRLILRPRP